MNEPMPAPGESQAVTPASDVPADPALLQAFWEYERALMADDLAAMDLLFAPGEHTLRGDAGGLLRGHDQIRAFRQARGGAPNRTIVSVDVRPLNDDNALVVAVTAPAKGGRGLQTQLWSRLDQRWVVRAAHVAVAPQTYDASVWRAVGDPLVSGAGDGPLRGVSLAVKDLFAVAGFPIGAGVPAYRAQARVEPRHAAAVQRLLDAGAVVRGIAATDQLAYSLAGDNAHYGTPVNPVVPGALPGGSSSGSAVAVSLGAADLGLATDTAGSVRVPASYQGLWGLRTSHGGVDVSGLLPLAPDFDTVGLLARDPDILAQAAGVLVSAPATSPGDRLIVPTRLPTVTAQVGELFASVPSRLGSSPEWQLATSDLGDVAEAAEAFRVHQAYQAWQQHGAFLSSHPGALRGAAADRFRVAETITAREDEAARLVLARWRVQLDDQLGSSVLVLPSAASAAPRVWASGGEVDASRAATLQLTCLAGITGRPAVSVPAWQTPEGPVGLCLVGPVGSDVALVGLAQRVAAQLG